MSGEAGGAVIIPAVRRSPCGCADCFARPAAPAVLDALEYAAYVHDVQHVILDNLQFMMSGAVGAAR